jgi:hypothetical protein
MKPLFLYGLLWTIAGSAQIHIATPASAEKKPDKAANPLKDKIEKADIVVVGKVTKVGLSAASSFDVGVIAVTEVLKGTKDVKSVHFRLGSRDPAAAKFGKKGVEGVWILDKKGAYLEARGVLSFQPLKEKDAIKKLVPGKPATPKDKYQALLKEYQEASSGGAASDEERMKVIGRVYKLRNKLAEQFVELAAKNPKDPIALDALIQAIWQVNGTPWPIEVVGEDPAQGRALALLERDHVQSAKLGPPCQRISFGFSKEYETFLRAVLAKNPHKEVQAQACLALAHFLYNRLQRLDMIIEDPKLAKEFSDLFGKEYLKKLQGQDRHKATTEAEGFFELAVKKYGDVKIPEDGTIGKKAKAELFEIRHLSVGKKAPDIEGRDQEGKRFRLSDYRGKVVLLDFWHQQ